MFDTNRAKNIYINLRKDFTLTAKGKKFPTMDIIEEEVALLTKPGYKTVRASGSSKDIANILLTFVQNKYISFDNFKIELSDETIIQADW